MYQRTIVVGHLGRDPEMRYTTSGQAVCSFSVATTRKWTGRDGQDQEKTTWFRVSVWGKQAESCSQYLAKGRLVLVEGDIDVSTWTGQDGQSRASLELNGRNVRFLGGRDGGAPGGGGGGGGGAPRAADEAPGGMDEEEIPF